MGSRQYQILSSLMVSIPFKATLSWVLTLAYPQAGHIGYYSFMGELKNPRDFPKALYLLQAAEIGIYLLASLVIYRYAGADVASPALGSAPSVVSKIAYGLALPAVCTYPIMSRFPIVNPTNISLRF